MTAADPVPGLPGWLAGYRLDDDALAVLANRGLVRRAAKEAVRIELDSATDTAVELRYVGTPPAQVRLLPGGPRQASCGCPVAGVCVHIVAACVWARESSPVEPVATQSPPGATPPQSVEPVQTPPPSVATPPRSGETQPPSVEPAQTQPPSVEVVETPGASPVATPPSSVKSPSETGFDKLNQPGVESFDQRGQQGPATPHDVEVQLLALPPAAVNRSAGIAAVRKVAAGVEPTPTTISPRPGSLRISWPGSPDIVAVPDGGFAGMLVAGRHSDTAERAWRLEALVRLFAVHGRPWTWPDKVNSTDVVHPGQREAMTQARDTIEALLQAGLSRVSPDGVQRLTAAAQRARLEALPLLATLLTQATGRAKALAGRADDTSERQLLDALARAWTLAIALLGSAPPLPPQLLGGQLRAGRGTGETAETGVLLPLAVRWWTAPSGARGLTVMLWDTEHHRVETASTGRAAGTDPSFTRSWDAPLLWGVSAQTLAGGLFTLHHAERRDDGTLSPTTRTRATPGERFSTAAVDLEQLADAIRGSARTAAATGFLPPPASLRLVLPRRLRGVAEPELDEVNQELRWPITDRSGGRHLARVPAIGAEQAVIGWLLRDSQQVAAVVLDDKDRPLSVFIVENGRLRLIAPSLTPPPSPPPGQQTRRGWLARRQPKDQRPRAHIAEQERPAPPLAQLTEAVLDVCEALAATGRPALSNRQRDTLQGRVEQASALGLSSLAAAIEPLLADRVTPAAVLRANLVASRARALADD